MVKRYGEDAAIQRADELLAEGDIDDAATWRAIIRAIEDANGDAYDGCAGACGKT